MKNKKAIIAVVAVVASLVIAYAGFVTADSIRLKKPGDIKKPIITMGEQLTDTRITYNGLGYDIIYSVNDVTPDGEKASAAVPYGAEFRLFGKILVWAWIE